MLYIFMDLKKISSGIHLDYFISKVCIYMHIYIYVYVYMYAFLPCFRVCVSDTVAASAISESFAVDVSLSETVAS